MFIDYVLLGLISLATIIWAFFTLPRDNGSRGDDDGGTYAGGDSSPTAGPPTIASPPNQGEQHDADEPAPSPQA